MNDVERYERIIFQDELFPININWDQSCEFEWHNSADDATWHEQLEILYFLDGDAVVECGFHRVRCSGGDIVIINPFEPHSVYRSGNAPRYHCFMIDPRLYGYGENDVCDIKYVLPLSNRHILFNNLVSNNTRVRSVVESLIGEYRSGNTAYELAVKGYIMLLIAELIRCETNNVVTGAEARRSSRGYSQIAPALRLIGETYQHPIRLTDLAQVCCMNTSYFCRRFREVTGMTTTDYINDYRITKAEALLVTTELTVTAVAQSCGFTDSSYFSRKFHALRSISPLALRKSVQAPNGGE